MATTGALYDDPGPDLYARRHPEKAKRRAIEQLRAMGYKVTLEPLQQPA
jgi:transposase